VANITKNLAQLAEQINAEHASALSAARTALEHARRAGQLLAEAKKQCPHGQWLPWLKANVSFSERTAQKYLRLAERWEELTAKAPYGADMNDRKSRLRAVERLSWANLTPTQKGLFLGVLVVPLLALLVYSMIPTKISQDNFDKIEPGMSEQEVESILGTGQEVPNTDPTVASAKVKSKMMRWQHGGIKIVVIFSDGKVSMKNMTAD
jgi:hypothetical protein